MPSSNVPQLHHDHAHFIAFSGVDIDNYSNVSDLESLYKVVKSYLLNGYSVIYGAESLKHDGENAKESIYKRISGAKIHPKDKDIHTGNDLGDEFANDFLTIVDSDNFYGNNKKGRDTVNCWIKQFSSIKSKVKDKSIKGILGISIPDPYFENDRYQDFMEFEEKVDDALSGNIGLLCWYKKKWLMNMALPDIIQVLNNHKGVLHKNLYLERFNNKKILDIIGNALDGTSKEDGETRQNEGTSASKLLFNTVKHAYHVDMDSLISDPTKLDAILSKTLGDDA
ncbi:MAG: hypothetical protein M3162_04205, partial [Thermoproteota archaeon]|nr:hypothetical protein [Thermoproteota archaeon]